jgi:hypothetical protein
MAGMKSNEMRASGVKLEKLARIMDWPQEKLDAIAYSAPRINRGGIDCWGILSCPRTLII